MRTRALAAGVLLLSAMLVPSRAQAATAIAFCYLDPGQFGGALHPTVTGWEWYLVCAYNDALGSNVIVSGVHAVTLSGDSLAQVGVKLANAAKADGAVRGFAITSVLLPQFVTVTPQ